MSKIIKIDDLVYQYKREEQLEPVSAVDHVSIDIEQGSFTAIIGKNGSGKSTLAKNINALLLPSGGAVYVILRCKETHVLARFGLLWIWLIQMGSYLMFNLQYPFGCTMDLRYIVPTIVVGAAYLGIALDHMKEKNKPLGNVLFYFGIAAIVAVAAASTLFYATSSIG